MPHSEMTDTIDGFHLEPDERAEFVGMDDSEVRKQTIRSVIETALRGRVPVLTVLISHLASAFTRAELPGRRPSPLEPPHPDPQAVKVVATAITAVVDTTRRTFPRDNGFQLMPGVNLDTGHPEYVIAVGYGSEMALKLWKAGRLIEMEAQNAHTITGSVEAPLKYEHLDVDKDEAFAQLDELAGVHDE